MTYICPICNNTGYIVQNNAFSSFCTCPIGTKIRTGLWEEKLLEAGILREYWNYKFKDFCPQPSYVQHMTFMRDTESYLKNIREKREEGNIWLILGSVGVGKTLAASLILKEAIKKDYSCYYIVWTDLVDGTLKDSDMLNQKIRSVDFLVIDDVGKDKIHAGKVSNFAEDLLEKIVKPRFSNKLPTILISPKDKRELFSNYPVLAGMISPQLVSEVTGLNFRLRPNLFRK